MKIMSLEHELQSEIFDAISRVVEKYRGRIKSQKKGFLKWRLLIERTARQSAYCVIYRKEKQY